MRFTWGVIVGLAIQGGLSQSGISPPSEGELTLRQETSAPDTEPAVTEVDQPVVSDTPPAQSAPAESIPSLNDPSPTDVSPPAVTESGEAGSPSEPASGGQTSVGTDPENTPGETQVQETQVQETQVNTESGLTTPTIAPPPPPEESGAATTPAVAPTDEPVATTGEAADSSEAPNKTAADQTDLPDNTGAADSSVKAPGQTPTKGEDSTVPVNSVAPTVVPSAISSAVESAITSAIRSAEEASTIADEASTVAKDATTVAGESRTVTNKVPASDGSSESTLTTRAAAATNTVSAPISLQSAKTGDNAEVKQVNGKPVVALSPPPNGEASFQVNVVKPDEVKKSDMVRIKASVTVSEVNDGAGTSSGNDTGCNVLMDVNGKNVYDQTLKASSNGPVDITSNFFEASEKNDVQFTQKCGDKPVGLTVDNMALQGQAKSDSGNGGSGTSSAAGSKSTNKDNLSSTNKPATFVVGLVAAMVVLFI